jgi:hypothetical protein
MLSLFSAHLRASRDRILFFIGYGLAKSVLSPFSKLLEAPFFNSCTCIDTVSCHVHYSGVRLVVRQRCGIKIEYQ